MPARQAGGSLEEQMSPGNLDTKRSKTTHKHLRAASSPEYVVHTKDGTSEQTCSNSIGQYHHGSISHESGRHKKHCAEPPSNQNTSMGRGSLRSPISNISFRRTKPPGKFPQQDKNRARGLVPGQNHFSGHCTKIGNASDRSHGIQSKQEVSNLSITLEDTGGGRPRCSRIHLGLSSSLSVSSSSLADRSLTEDKKGQGGSNPDSTRLAQEDVVLRSEEVISQRSNHASSSASPVITGANIAPASSLLETDGLAAKWSSLRLSGLSEPVIDTFISGRLSSSSKIYKCCQYRHLDGSSISIGKILDFLQEGFNKGLKPASIKVQLSDLSAILATPFAELYEFTDCVGESSSVLTDDTQDFLTKLLNRQSRLQELSSQLSGMTFSETLHQTLNGSDEQWPLNELSCCKVVTMLRKLREADLTASSIETVLRDVKDCFEGILKADNVSSLDVKNISKQNDLLWKELEAFKDIRKILERFLKTHSSKFDRSANRKSLEVLMGQLLEHEAENVRLREQVIEKEAKAADLSRLIKEEKVSVVKSTQISRSVEVTHDRLQNLLQKKENENQGIVSHIQSLETVISGQKLEIEDIKHQISHIKEKCAFEKEGLKKAIHVQKQKADRLQAALENVTDQIKEKEMQLSEVLSSWNIWKTHHDCAVETKTNLEVQHETLTVKISDHLKNMKKIEEESEHTKEELAEKLRTINLQNSHFSQENAKLKASITALENESVLVNSALSSLQEKADQQRTFAEEYENQVQKLQKEAKELKQRFEVVLTDKKQIIENKNCENKKEPSIKVSSGQEGRVLAFKGFQRPRSWLLQLGSQNQHPEEEWVFLILIATVMQVLRSVSSKVYHRFSSLGHSASKVPVASWIKADATDYFLGNKSFEMENNRIAKKCEELGIKIEKMIIQNQLLEQLKTQESNLQQSQLQLEDKSRECGTLVRLLENAVEEGRKQMSEETDKVLSSELALQRKLQSIEKELKRKKAEHKQLASTLQSFEKNCSLRLEELQHSLEIAESRNQRIQNYVHFLKTSYATMFK
ncbi:protein BCAP [Rhinophrynus dorsalis]